MIDREKERLLFSPCVFLYEIHLFSRGDNPGPIKKDRERGREREREREKERERERERDYLIIICQSHSLHT